MTTASPSLAAFSYVADTPTSMHIVLDIRPELDTIGRRFIRGGSLPSETMLRSIVENLWANPRVGDIFVSPYGLTVEHDHAMPSVIMDSVERGIAAAQP